MSADRVTPARRAAFEVLRRVFEHGAWADRALPAALAHHGAGERERGLAQRLAFGAVQRRGTSDHLAERLGGRPAGGLDPPVAAALRLGLYELLFAAATPDHAAVDQAVELAKGGLGAAGVRGGRARAASGFANAVLRRAGREREALLASLTDADPASAAIAHSYPEWLARMWWDELGPDAARALMAAMNEPAETALRVNTLRAEPAALAARLREAGAELERGGEGILWPPEALVARGPLAGPLAAALERGELVAQSRASQAVVALLDPRPGERLLDLCAGPGVKTSAIAARLGDRGELVALELDAGRARQIEALCARLGASCVRVVQGDAREADLGAGYDRVLVDPPCSDLGTLASRPDARWRKDPGGIERLAALQAELLDRAARALRPGGTLVYSVCTISRREGEEVAAAAPAGLRPDGPALLTRPDRDRTDGFFAARFRREASDG